MSRHATRAGIGAAAALLAGLVAAPAAAETPAPPAPAAPADPVAAAAQIAAERAAEKARREAGLRLLEGEIGASATARERLTADIARIGRDRAALAAELVASAAQARDLEERVGAVQGRLDGFLDRETVLRRSLQDRRGLIAEVLAALQRMGRRPPPAVLVRVDDVLAAIRTSMLLGAVVPGLRDETRRLAADLAELTEIRTAVAAERRELDAAFSALARERARLGGLVEARQRQLAAAETELGGERARSLALAEKAAGLRDLVDRLDGEVTAARKAAEAARLGAEAARAQAEREVRETRERFAAASLRSPARLAPRQPFASTKGVLPRPASGAVLREFGAPDGSGGALRGVAIAALPRAAVTSPADGTVVFAGPFRTYGRLLIIDAGDGYYLLLAGLDRSTVDVGQFVLAGEPVGQMGETASASAAMGVVEADGPVLYFELRKDGGPVDPGPWWAKSQTGRARG